MDPEYDSIADEYDATRDAATDDEIEALAKSLQDCKTVLDVGIGTGRFARPLQELGFEMIGVDVSRRMLMKAGAKGLPKLVIGDAYKLPFANKSIDGAIIIHVLHVVVDWATVVSEIGRVTKGPVAAILRVPHLGTLSPNDSGATSSEVQAVDMGAGYPIRTTHRLWENEIALVRTVPPRRQERIRDELVSMPLSEAFKRLQAKRSMGAQIAPPERQVEIMKRISAFRGTQAVHKRVVEDLAVWDASQFEPLDRTNGPP